MAGWRRAGCALLVLAALVPGAAAGQSRLTLQLGGPRQAQFAGYYVAEARGLYSAAGLSVTILPGRAGGDDDPPDTASGADIWSAWLPAALAARDRGLALVNFGQVFPHSGLELVCRKDRGIHSPADFRGKAFAVWPGAERIPFLALLGRLSLAPADVTLVAVPRGSGPAAVAPLLDGRAACIMALNYDQYWTAADAGLPPGSLQVFHFGDFGVATLQDGLYATAASLADPDRADALRRFLQASLQGWSYAVAHQSEAVSIVLGSPGDAATRTRAVRMMSAVARLTESGLQPMGYLEPAAYDRTVQLLGAHPAGLAWTHAIWKKAH